MDLQIKQLVRYALTAGLIEPADEVWAVNRLLETMGATDYSDPAIPVELPALEALLDALCDEAVRSGKIPHDTPTFRDLFDTALIGALTPRPSEVNRTFSRLYADDPKAATDWFYRFSQDTAYIRRWRIEKDVRWKAATPFGTLDITINLSKPEKDPAAIAAAASAKPSGYPKCLLCAENEGYAGRADAPARQNHRVVGLTITGEAWGLQYSPYVYYNEHCIVFNRAHVPMKIDAAVFGKLFDFVEQFPHYFIGSNADLPIVGGSILSHEHFQGGNYEFAMAKAPVKTPFAFPGFPEVDAGIVDWPMSVIRLSGKDRAALEALSDKILCAWRGYTDADSFVFAQTDGTPHNTITPIARKRGARFEIDLVLRNNITTPEHPCGVYHPHAELHHIKKENIGLIEVMGLAVLPARLREEMDALAAAMLAGAELSADEALAKHADWAAEIRANHSEFAAHNAAEILRAEIGNVFLQVLSHAGVFKEQAPFLRFLESVK
ncbi:MAG: UDP-glucose--hexose-1-phosphate uridylyltransferase [Oscillospiraceae bacterium]